MQEKNLKAIQLTKKFVNGYQTPICISLNNLIKSLNLFWKLELKSLSLSTHLLYKLDKIESLQLWKSSFAHYISANNPEEVQF